MTEPHHPYRPLSPDFLTELFQDPLDQGYADAAARRAATSDTTGGAGHSRWLRGARVASLLALVTVGLVLAVAYRQVVAEEPTRTQVRTDLEQQIDERQAETEALEQRADELREEVARLRDEQLDDPTAVRELRELEAAAGLGPVHGDGAVVRLTDGPADVDPVTGEPVVDPQARIIDQDLQRVVNALWAAGAEAVAVNDRRLTATSTIRGASGAILVDQQPVAGPYEVVAIGPDALPDRFRDSQAGQLFRLLVDEFGIGYEVRPGSDLTLPAASEPQLYHATPVTDR